MHGPWAPYMNGCSLIACGVGDTGYARFGKITDIEVHSVLNGEIFIFYTLETFGEDPDLFAVYLFEDGICSAKSKTGEIIYRPDRSRAVPEIELYLFPDEEGWEGFSGAGNYIDRDQVKLSWTYSGGSVKRVNILHNPGSSINSALSPKQALTQPVATVSIATAPYSGGKLYASGKWTDKKTKTASILIEIVAAGTPGTATFQYTYGDFTSATETTRTYPQRIANGLKVWFEAGASYQVGDNWMIEVGIVKEWLSRPLADGAHAFAVETVANSGVEQQSNTLQKTINGFPTAPTLESYSYLGDGEIELSYTIPDEADIVEANFYTNRPDMDDGFIHWGPLAGLGQSATPDTTLGPVTVTGLVEGKNRIVCRLTDSAGQEEQNVDWLEIVLDASLNQVTVPNAPFSISGSEIAGDSVRVSVYADSTSDEIKIYKGTLDGVDYETVIATIANPQAGIYQLLTEDIDWSAFGAGDFLIAARASNGTYTEANTDIWNRVHVELVAPPVAVLTGEVV